MDRGTYGCLFLQRRAPHLLPLESKQFRSVLNSLIHVSFEYNYHFSSAVRPSWGHVASKDLIHWIHLTTALSPDQDYDKEGVWGGSASLVEQANFNEDGPVLIYTCRDSTQTNKLCLAHPKEEKAFAIEWVKFNRNPIEPGFPNRVSKGSFSDPSSAQKFADTWMLLVGTKTEDGSNSLGAMLSRLQFDDFKFSHYFHNSTRDLQPSLATTWSSPDWFQVLDPKNLQGLSYVLKYTNGDTIDYWLAGRLKKGALFEPTAPPQIVNFGSKFHGAKTYWESSWSGGRNRRIMVGVIEEDPKVTNRKPSNPHHRRSIEALAPFSGVLSMPCEVGFDAIASTVTCSPVKDYEALRYQAVTIKDFTVAANGFVLKGVKSGPEMEILAEFRLPPPGRRRFGLNVLQSPSSTPRNITSTQIFIEIDTRSNITNIMVGIDRSLAATEGSTSVESGPLKLLPIETVINLRVFIDHSVVEAFFQNGRVVVSSRVYTHVENDLVSILTDNREVTVSRFETWRLNSIWEGPGLGDADAKALV